MAPARITHPIVLSYTGPPIRGSVFASFVDRIPEGMSSPGIAVGAEGIREQCKGTNRSSASAAR